MNVLLDRFEKVETYMKRILTAVVCLILIQSVQAQSIYSFEGLGSLNHQGMPNNMGMGEVGIGTPTVWHINTQNPANLAYNNFSTFQVGMEIDRRNFSGENLSGSDVDGGLRFLAFAFPIMPGKWSSSFGILPYSTVSYNTFSEGPVPNGEEGVFQNTNDRGSGGLTNFFWANGFKIKKKFLIGFRANFTFGSIDRTSDIFLLREQELITENENNVNDTTLVNVSIANPITYSERESHRDFNLQIGVGYRHKLGEFTFLNFGATFSPRSALDGTSDLSLIRLTNSGRTIESVDIGSEDIQFDLPLSFGYGMSYERVSHYKVGFDIETQAWGSAGNDSQEYNNSVKFAMGAEWTPDFDNVSSYWKRAKYSIGFNYHKLPYIVNNQALIDFGINFGASLPVSGYSSLDLAFKWGQLGETTNGLIKENYFKIVIGATLNDTWFIKRKYD